MKIYLALGLLLVTPVSTLAQTTEQSTISNQPDEAVLRMQLATELVKMTYPAAKAKAASLVAYETNFRQSFLSNPQNVAVAARHPGIVDAMATAGKAEMSRITDEIEPKILAAVAAGYADALSISDLRETMAFYNSEAGKALASLDPSTMDSNGMVSLTALSENHRRAIGRYQEGSAGQRTRNATSQAFTRIPTVVAQIFPPYQPRLTARITAAGNAFIAAERPKK